MIIPLPAGAGKIRLIAVPAIPTGAPTKVASKQREAKLLTPDVHIG